MPRARRILGLADAVMKIVRDTMAETHLKAVIVRATVDGKEVLTLAVGDSTLLLILVGNTEFNEALYEDPFRQWEPD